ncbi:hypothetical protein VHEMI00225 [[Torrubiella] hemipterigena]|uniref:Cyclin-dependent kinase n=1 Tax=[Torrubiella] hemipterigena TaxID=1531966 RepID=A0A0A1SIP5_9HYPO|nr:hypothetical protein VHEMI00225 [[Torrubiella] hemipterigena]
MTSDSHGGISILVPPARMSPAAAVDTPASSASSARLDTVPATPPIPASEGRVSPGAAGKANATEYRRTGMDAVADSQDTISSTVPNSQEDSANGVVPLQPETVLQASAAVAASASRKRMADGEVKDRTRSTSPVKGHTRTMSAMSTTSSGSHIGDMSAELKTRLTYAMVKVNHGWQSRSIQEVESLASQAASPASSNSTLHRPMGSSASPNLPPTPPTQVNFGPDRIIPPRSMSPPDATKPKLAPPAPIQPATKTNSRRTAHSRNTPALPAHASASAIHSNTRTTPKSFPNHISSSQSSHSGGQTYSPHQHVREQDAIETLLFMSSPGNSANMKSTFSPSASPVPQVDVVRAFESKSSISDSSSSERRPLPVHRPGQSSKRVGFEKSPLMGPPHSPMDVDSPQQFVSPRRWTPRARANGATGHMRAALSLPSGLGAGASKVRQTVRDEDIERMLDRAADDSSDDEEIQIPGRPSAITSAMGG